MAKFNSLDAYAEHIRVKTFRLSAQLFRELGTSHPAALAVAELHEEAASIVTGLEMDREQADVENLDLRALPKDNKPQ